jgi:hypothetical protein
MTCMLHIPPRMYLVLKMYSLGILYLRHCVTMLLLIIALYGLPSASPAAFTYSSKLETLGWIPPSVLWRAVSWPRIPRSRLDARKSDPNIWCPHACVRPATGPCGRGCCERLFGMSIRAVLGVLGIGLSLLL